MKYNDYIVQGILSINQLLITQVENLESLNTILFSRDEYSEIERLIKTGNIEGLKMLQKGQVNSREYLDILLFYNQEGRPFIVTVYDNDELEQDPEIIEVYSL